MKLIAALGFAAALAGAALSTALPARADEFTPAQKQELGAFIHDYLVSNPEVLRTRSRRSTSRTRRPRRPSARRSS